MALTWPFSVTRWSLLLGPALGMATVTASTTGPLVGCNRSATLDGANTDPSPSTTRLQIDAVEVVGGTVANAVRVVNGMRAALLACHERGLAGSPRQGGTLRVTIDVGANGEVLLARTVGGDDISRETRDCIVRRAQAASFAPPEGTKQQYGGPLSNVTVGFGLTLTVADGGLTFK